MRADGRFGGGDGREGETEVGSRDQSQQIVLMLFTCCWGAHRGGGKKAEKGGKTTHRDAGLEAMKGKRFDHRAIERAAIDSSDR